MPQELTFTYGIASVEDIQSIANAIRSKAEISDSLEFPAGFVSAISGIDVGYVSGDINKTVTGNITPSQGSSTAVSGNVYGDIDGYVGGNVGGNVDGSVG